MSLTEETSRQISRLKARRPEYAHLLNLCQAFYLAIESAAHQINLPIRLPDRPHERLQMGFSLWSVENLPLDMNKTIALLEAFARIPAPDVAELNHLADLLTSDRNRVVAVIRAWLAGQEEPLTALARTAGMTPDLLFFLLGLALKPSWLALRAAHQDRLAALTWKQGFCPLCGSPPGMARLEKDGTRTLGCRLCGQEWPYPRLRCPGCETEKQADLSYIFSEQEEGYRIQICRGCSTYLKTVDARVLEEPADLDLEDLTTMHLDLLAHERGLTRIPSRVS